MPGSDRTECVQSLAALSLTEASDHRVKAMVIQSTLVVLDTEWQAAPDVLQSDKVYCPELRCTMFWVRVQGLAERIALVVRPDDVDRWRIHQATTADGGVVNTNCYVCQRAWEEFKKGGPTLIPATGVVAQEVPGGGHVYSARLTFPLPEADN